MYIQFDKTRMHIQVICGSLEEYKPSEEIKEIQQKLDSLKEKLSEFQNKVVFPELSDIEAKINKINPKIKSEE